MYKNVLEILKLIFFVSKFYESYKLTTSFLNPSKIISFSPYNSPKNTLYKFIPNTICNKKSEEKMLYIPPLNLVYLFLNKQNKSN